MSTDNSYNENRYLLNRMQILLINSQKCTQSQYQRDIKKDIDSSVTSGTLEKHNAIVVEN